MTEEEDEDDEEDEEEEDEEEEDEDNWILLAYLLYLSACLLYDYFTFPYLRRTRGRNVEDI